MNVAKTSDDILSWQHWTACMVDISSARRFEVGRPTLSLPLIATRLERARSGSSVRAHERLVWGRLRTVSYQVAIAI